MPGPLPLIQNSKQPSRKKIMHTHVCMQGLLQEKNNANAPYPCQGYAALTPCFPHVSPKLFFSPPRPFTSPPGTDYFIFPKNPCKSNSSSYCLSSQSSPRSSSQPFLPFSLTSPVASTMSSSRSSPVPLSEGLSKPSAVSPRLNKSRI